MMLSFAILTYAINCKILVLSNIQLDPYFEDSCHFGHCTDLGKYGQGSPVSLLNLVLKDAQKQFNNSSSLDAIVITGNMVSPKIKQLRGTKNIDLKWRIYKEVYAKLTDEIKKRFPNVPILPVLGVNDNLWEYEAPE